MRRLEDREVRIFLVGIFFIFVFLGCRDRVTWTAECRSDDGNWIATAKTFEHGGFGTAGVETTVEVRRSKDTAPPERVLSLAEGGRDIGLKMRWDGSSHLAVVYRGSPELLYFQVVKTSGFDISVQNVSHDPSQEFHPSARP